jgi:serine/threonine-protein kinase
VAQIDDSVNLLAEKPPLDEQDDEQAPVDEADRLTATLPASALNLDELVQEEPGQDKGLVTLAQPDPVRFLQGQLHELWKEAVNALASQPRAGPSGAPKAPGHKHTPLGPFRLVVVASIRGRAAGQIAIQGMSNKQIELTTPSFRTTGSAGKPILAVWIYRDNSLVISHLDFHGSERYVLWHAPLAHQVKFDDPADLHRELENLRMEPPEQVDAALSRRFRPKNTV